jgi:hypothetical protein
MILWQGWRMTADFTAFDWGKCKSTKDVNGVRPVARTASVEGKKSTLLTIAIDSVGLRLSPGRRPRTCHGVEEVGSACPSLFRANAGVHTGLRADV